MNEDRTPKIKPVHSDDRVNLWETLPLDSPMAIFLNRALTVISTVVTVHTPCPRNGLKQRCGSTAICRWRFSMPLQSR